MRFDGSIHVNVLSLTETIERCLEHLDTLDTYSKRNLSRRNCTCSTESSSTPNSLSKLNEDAQEQLLKEVEIALHNASLVWNATHESSRTTKKRVKDAALSTPMEPPKLAELQKSRPNASVGHKLSRTNCPKVCKPVYQTAPYKTEVVKPQKHPIRYPHKAHATAELAKLASRRPSDVAFKTGISHDPLSSSVYVEPTTTSVKPTELRTINNKAIKGMLAADNGFGCACFEEKKLAALETVVTKSHRLRSLVINYNFGHTDSSAWNFISTFNAQLLKRGDYSSIGILLSRAYDETTRLFSHFRYLVEFLDMHLLDSEQLLWIRQVFDRFLLLRDIMRVCLQQITENSVKKLAYMDTADDPLETWLSDVKSNKSDDIKPSCLGHWPLKAYFTIGPGSTNCHSRLFLLTSLSNFHTLHGDSAQRDEFLRLWEALESEQLETDLLRALQVLLPQLTSHISSHPNRASLFRELYGFISSSYPVALKDTYGP